MSHKSVNRFRWILRAILAVLILVGGTVTVINVLGSDGPPEINAGLTITLHEQPTRGYGAADVELGGRRFVLSDRAELEDALTQSLSDDSNPVCLLRVAAGVSQKSIYQLQEMLSRGAGQNWSFHVVMLQQQSE